MAYVNEDDDEIYNKYLQRLPLDDDQLSDPLEHTLPEDEATPLYTEAPPEAPTTTEGALSKRSRQVQQAKSTTSYPNGLIGDCFETTGMIVGAKACLKVTHMMLDTGAASIFISAAAAKAARLHITTCEPKTFQLADGSKSTHNQHTHFELYMAGVHAHVVAFIDNGTSKHHILFGKPGVKAFNATANFSFGKQKETRWFVAQDVTGMRRHKILLQEDARDAIASLTTYSLQEGLFLAQQRGETASQRYSREVLERAEKRGKKLRKKHSPNLWQYTSEKDFPDLFGPSRDGDAGL